MKIRFLSGNMLKILAAVFMTVDHIGVIFFPTERIFRIIGRLALPIFAFMISEGARYTKNRVKYLGLIAVLAAVCQAVYFFAMDSLDMCILVTFTLSIVMIYALDGVKRELSREKILPIRLIISLLLFFLSLLFSYIFCDSFSVDYGFRGALLPLFASLPDMKRTGRRLPAWCGSVYLRIAALAVGLIFLAGDFYGLQIYALFAIPLLCLYSEKRGKLKMKYFFYIFYPLHLVLLEGIYVLMYGI